MRKNAFLEEFYSKAVAPAKSRRNDYHCTVKKKLDRIGHYFRIDYYYRKGTF